ncbi:glutathione peroxidase 1 [Eurytemora carolleeae]|uniref:glutathione peroxidase 1 n=1 Tax=Eurytemora carolleeae TaxID=1294199 RepID=UPI000C769497|nr:glutathione peroxidase 1 [Eurytemora carolleeae]|eukprot:XP_023335721.1 glutathione peroxidase 1-like [Eurytemora affinis]
MARQYPDFNALKESFNGLVDVIGIPCTQFLNQEPGTPEEIMNALEHVRPGNGFMPNFQLFQKSEINGINRIPLYQWALGLCDTPDMAFSDKSYLLYGPLNSNDIRWNFEKILFDKNGNPVKRYTPSTEVVEIIPDIEELLGEKANWIF